MNLQVGRKPTWAHIDQLSVDEMSRERVGVGGAVDIIAHEIIPLTTTKRLSTTAWATESHRAIYLFCFEDDEAHADDKKPISSKGQNFERQQPLTEHSIPPSILGLQSQRKQHGSVVYQMSDNHGPIMDTTHANIQPGVLYDFFDFKTLPIFIQFSGNERYVLNLRAPTRLATDLPDVILQRPAGLAYSTTSNKMSSKCDSRSPPTLRKRESPATLHFNHTFGLLRRLFLGGPPWDCNFDPLERQRLPTSTTSADSKIQIPPATLHTKRSPRAYNLRSHLKPADEQPFIHMIYNIAFTPQPEKQQHKKLHNGENHSTFKSPDATDAENYIYETYNPVVVVQTILEVVLNFSYTETATGITQAPTINKLKTTNRNPPLTMSTTFPATTIFPVQTRVQLRPNLEHNSLVRYWLPKSETDYTVDVTEATRAPDNCTGDFIYYGFIPDYIYSETLHLFDLDTQITRKVYGSEAHKVYGLNRLPQADLEARVLQAYGIAAAIPEKSEQFRDAPTHRHTHKLAEERRFAAASEASPSACRLLMRTPMSDAAWGSWVGVKYYMDPASGFTPWEQRLCIDESKQILPKPSPPATREAMLTPEEPLQLSAAEIGGDLKGQAGQFQVDVTPQGKSDIIESVESKGFDGNTSSIEERTSHPVVSTKLYMDIQQPVTTILSPFNPECGLSTGPASSPQSPTDEEGLSQPETPTSGPLSSEASVKTCTKRRILERIIVEFSAEFFSLHSGIVCSQSEGSKITFSNHGAKPCSSSNQVSQGRSAISTGKKRAQPRDLSSEDEDDGDQKRQKKANSTNSAISRAQLLACPFNKYDPRTYGRYNEDIAMARKFKTCGGPGWDKIHRLKEHLGRVHTDPILCQRCQLLFKTKKDLTEHIRKQSPCEMLQPQLVKWISPEEIKSLKDDKRAPKGRGEGEKWKYVYGILFPEELNIPSPYHDHTDLKQYWENWLVRQIEKATTQELRKIIHKFLAQMFRESHGEPSLPEPKSWDGLPSMSNIEPEPENAFGGPLQFKDNGEGPSRAITDSRYNSLYQNSDITPSELFETPTLLPDTDTENVRSLQQDQEDAFWQGLCLPDWEQL